MESKILDFLHASNLIDKISKNLQNTPQKSKNADKISATLAGISDDFKRLHKGEILRWFNGDPFNKIWQVIGYISDDTDTFKGEKFRETIDSLEAIATWVAEHMCSSNNRSSYGADFQEYSAKQKRAVAPNIFNESDSDDENLPRLNNFSK